MTEKTAPPERTEVVRLRCTQAEKMAWEERAKREGRTLSDLVRESLGQKLDTKPKTRARRADPRLVAEVARIGNNANQIARWCNTNAGPADRLQVLAVLCAMEEELQAMLAEWREKGSTAGAD